MCVWQSYPLSFLESETLISFLDGFKEILVIASTSVILDKVKINYLVVSVVSQMENEGK